MRRRDFLTSSAVVAGAGLLAQGCDRSQQPGRDKSAVTGVAKTARRSDQPSIPRERWGLQVLHHGLCLFVMPASGGGTKPVDVVFIDARLNDKLAGIVHVHTPTLRVDKADVHINSTADPAASTDETSFYALTGLVQMIGTASPDLEDWGKGPTLKLKDEPLTDLNPANCPSGPAWNNMKWVLDFTELSSQARLPGADSATWLKTGKFKGVLSLRDGFLETDECPPGGSERSRYIVNERQRMLKDQVRCFVRASEFPFVQFKFMPQGDEKPKALVIKNAVEAKPFINVQVFHLPTPGMNPGDGKLTDYLAMYDALLAPREGVDADPTQRRTLSARRVECGGDTPNSGNCAPLRITG